MEMNATGPNAIGPGPTCRNEPGRFAATPPAAHGWLHRFLVVSYETVMELLFRLPRYPICNRLKAAFLRCMGAKIGKRVVFYPGVWISAPPGCTLEIGEDVDLARDVIITAAGGVVIGERTLVGYRTHIHSANHLIPPGRGSIFFAPADKRPVVIGKDAWIGANCTIVPGVTIGEGSVVGGGSVVTRSVEPFTIVAGNPARLIHRRTAE
jgi:acetyltransferase-like isoleucine patch superfamily enzyme